MKQNWTPGSQPGGVALRDKLGGLKPAAPQARRAVRLLWSGALQGAGIQKQTAPG
jgi:hypothetical protein